MKRRIFFLVYIALVVFTLSATETGWEWDAEKADSFFYSEDYDAAWLFYERAMIAGADDAKVLFRAAESFDSQQLLENPELGTALYAVSSALMKEQYPDDNVIALAESKADPEIVVNRRYIRKTFGMIGAKAPRTRRDLSAGIPGRVAAFGTGKVEELGTFFSILVSEGFREAIGWTRGRMWDLLLAYLIISFIPGIILPAVLAITVAREGRKSYVTAYLFLLYWGPLGIHRFYLGRYISGIIWLLTGGLAGLGVFFDIFLTGAYIRFWNEDHRDSRPSAGRNSAGAGVSRKVKTPRAPKPARPAKPKKVRAPKPPKAARAPKASGNRKNRETNTEFNSGAAVGGSAALAANAMDDYSLNEPATEDSFDLPGIGDTDDFGDLPDLDLSSDDFDIPTADGGNDGLTDLAGGADEDEFDLGSLE